MMSTMHSSVKREKGVYTRQAVMKREGQLGTAIDSTSEQRLLVMC
jgi:hypothetical protein